MFKKIFLLAMTSVILQISCSDNFYELMEQEEQHHLAVEATLDPTSGSSINARDTITITFSKAMNPDTLKLAGDLAGGTGEWTTATNANDTLTLSPNQAWVVGADKTLRVDCESSEGIVMDTLDAVYEVTYSITGSPDITTGSAITGTESIVITFDDPMDTTSLSIAGTLINNDSANVTVTWSTASETNDTVTLTPANTIWPSERVDLTLTINGNSAYGPVMATVELTYTVEYVVYVKQENSSNSYPGTRTQPRATIQNAVDYADSLYTTAAVRVAKGTLGPYTASGAPVVSMKNGISLYGGYSADDWSLRDTSAYETVLEDERTTSSTDWEDPNRAVDCNTTISNSIIIDGFTIRGGGGDYATGILSKIGCSPTISNNKIYGGSQGNGRTYGILNISSSPIINKNYIYGGTGESNDYSYGIFNAQTGQPSPPDCTPTIKYNPIDGGVGYRSRGVYADSSVNVNIYNNKITGGEGENQTYGIYISNSSSLIYNNIVFGGRGEYRTYGIYISASSPLIYNNTIDGGYPSISDVNNRVYCVYITGSSSPNINNNILTVESYTTNFVETCIYEDQATSQPNSLDNNDIVNCRDSLYFDNADTNDVDDISAINLFAFATGNVELVPSFENTGSSVSWTNVNFHLTSSSPVNVRQGGLDGSFLSWVFSNDYSDTTRTNLTDGPNNSPDNTDAAGWSMGAYEYD